jgi:prophage regulatory protein
MTEQSKIIRLRATQDKTGLSRSTIYRLSKDPNSDFPGAVRLTPATVGWLESEVNAWLASRKAVVA